MTEATPLKAEVINSGLPGPHLLITAGVHGDELEPMIAIRRLRRRPELATLRGRLTLVPIVNEAARARRNRVADDGLDLARTCPGKADGSITERTAHAVSTLVRTADFYIDLHTGGAVLSIWPMTGYMLHPRPDVLEKQRGLARAFNLPVIWGTDASLEGRTLSVARDASIPAIYAEYLGGGRVSRAGVRSLVRGCLNVLSHLEMIDRAQEQPQIKISVEDPRQGSGHMQSGYPSPVDGRFEPFVKLGQRVEPGDAIGHVLDAANQQLHPIRAVAGGWVLVLRAIAAVTKGDGLAVVLKAERGSFIA
jgi:predicted deacylase